MATHHEARAAIAEARRALGIEHLSCAIHDASFPGDDAEDVGHGSPYGRGAARFFALLHELGFDVVQLGPQGRTDPGNPSPYDGTAFARSPLGIALGDLCEPTLLAALTRARPAGALAHVAYAYAWPAQERALGSIFEAWRRGGPGPSHAAAREFQERAYAWLAPYANFVALARRYGDNPRFFSEAPDLVAGEDLEREAFVQLLAHEQHAALRARLAPLGLKLFGDVPVGVSLADRFAHPSLFLPGYALGAPPSRTNPDGQPWGYPVLDPENDGALRFVEARFAHALDAYDGLRIDHPHGLVCPWVYRTDLPDPFAAVRSGARHFAAPDFPDHPRLARYAISRPAELRRDVPRHADDWADALDDAQVDAYGRVLDRLVALARTRGATLLCEVLSTLPTPLARVLARHGLGRFRVTQKARLADPNDVYRCEHARPEDWIMIGTHDTPPIWRLAAEWEARGGLSARARYLAERLAPEEGARAAFAERLARDRRALVRAELAAVFASPARHVMIFFAELLGCTEVYNRPGIVDEENWTLRVPPDFERVYQGRLARGEALDLPGALAMALRARRTPTEPGLIARLEEISLS